MRRLLAQHARAARAGGTRGRRPVARARGGLGGRRRRHAERRRPPARRPHPRAAARSLPLPRRRLRGRHRARVPAPNYDPLYGSLAADHRPDARQPRVGEPLQRLLPVLAREEGTQAAALVEHEHRGLADPLAQLDDGPRARLASAALAAARAHGRRRATAASPSRTRPASAPASTRTTRGWRRSGTRCAATRGLPERPRPQPAAAAPLGRHHAVHRGSGRRERLRGRSGRSAARLGRRWPLRRAADRARAGQGDLRVPRLARAPARPEPQNLRVLAVPC